MPVDDDYIGETFVCIRCLQAGLGKEFSTYPISEAGEHDYTSDMWCQHCVITEDECE